jgi:phosphohistidine phosphatase
MARRLWLLRHAKSSWDDPALSDRLRPLAPRGVRSAVALARHVRSAGVAPDLVLCSPAVRAVQTWEGVSPGVPPGTRLELDEAIYHAGAGHLMRRLQQVPPTVGSVLVIGHNPTLEDLAIGLVGAGDPVLRRRLASKFPTGALATVELPGDWHDLGWGAATLVGYVVPREL